MFLLDGFDERAGQLGCGSDSDFCRRSSDVGKSYNYGHDDAIALLQTNKEKTLLEETNESGAFFAAPLSSNGRFRHTQDHCC